MFSKSKRFQDPEPQAPPVGLYTVNVQGAKAGPVTFLKSSRFTEPKESLGSCSINKSDQSDAMNTTALSFSSAYKALTTSSVKKACRAQSSLKSSDTDTCRKSFDWDIQCVEGNLSSLREKIQELESKLAVAVQQAQDTEKEIEELNASLAQVQLEKLSLEENIRFLNAQLQEVKLHYTSSNDAIQLQLEEKRSLADSLSRKLDDQGLMYEQEKRKLEHRLELAVNLNCDLREQLESVELQMTENLRGLSIKYECLEETLEHVQKDYKNRLERANSQLEKTHRSYEDCKEDLSTMHTAYTNLKNDFEFLASESEDHSHKINEQEELLTQEKEKGTSLMLKIKELEAARQKLSEELMEKLTLSNRQLQDEKQNSQSRNEAYDMQICNLERKIYEQETSYASLDKELTRLQRDIYSVTEARDGLKASCVILQSELDDARAQQEFIIEENNRLTVELEKAQAHLSLRTTELETLSKSQESLMLLKENLQTELVSKTNSHSVTVERLESDIREEKKKFQSATEEMGRRLLETQARLSKAEASMNGRVDEAVFKEAVEEAEKWKKKFAELEEKVGPFMGQLDGYEAEKQALLNQKAFTQSEMTKLSEQYAQLLGHQNNKQKIHHIRKLKEENLDLKTEVLQLRTKAAKDKKLLALLEDKLASRNGEKRFDKARAFALEYEGDKENVRQPLRAANS